MNPSDPTKERRRAEEALRNAVRFLESHGMEEEAEDLCFRLQQEIARRVARYLDREADT